MVMAPNTVDSKTISPITEDGSMDRRGNPAVKASTGKWKSSILLLVNYALVTCAFFGVGVNLVVFLRRVLHQDNAEAANSISKWTGTVYIFSLIGAFMSDSYWGRYITCAVFQMIYVTGLVILSLASWFLLVKPTGCGDEETNCDPPSTAGVALFYLSTYMIAFGNGGYQPSIATLGSDQFDETDPEEARSKVAFFSYFYLALNVGSLFSNTVLVYYEDAGQWVMGFWVSAGAAALALVLFLLGTPNYRYFKPSGNPLTRIAQVLVAASRKWRTDAPAHGELLHELEGDESYKEAGIRKILHSDQLRYLDKAATLTEEEYSDPENLKNPWRLCMYVGHVGVRHPQRAGVHRHLPARAGAGHGEAVREPAGADGAAAHGRRSRDWHGGDGGGGRGGGGAAEAGARVRAGPAELPERAVAGAAVRADRGVGGVHVCRAAGVLQWSGARRRQELRQLAVHGVHLARELREYHAGQRGDKPHRRGQEARMDPRKPQLRPPRQVLLPPRGALTRRPGRARGLRDVVQGHQARQQRRKRKSACAFLGLLAREVSEVGLRFAQPTYNGCGSAFLKFRNIKLLWHLCLHLAGLP